MSEADKTPSVPPLEPPPEGKVLVGFGAQWVGVWRPFEELLKQLDSEGTRTVLVDVDEHPGVADRYAVVSLPTFVVLQDGREVRRRLGAVSESDVRSMVK